MFLLMGRGWASGASSLSDLESLALAFLWRDEIGRGSCAYQWGLGLNLGVSHNQGVCIFTDKLVPRCYLISVLMLVQLRVRIPSSLWEIYISWLGLTPVHSPLYLRKLKFLGNYGPPVSVASAFHLDSTWQLIVLGCIRFYEPSGCGNGSGPNQTANPKRTSAVPV